MSVLNEEIRALEALIRLKEQQRLQLEQQEVAPASTTPSPSAPPAAPAPPASAWAARYAQMLREQQEEQDALNQPPVNRVYRRVGEYTPYMRIDPNRPLSDYFPRRRRNGRPL